MLDGDKYTEGRTWFVETLNPAAEAALVASRIPKSSFPGHCFMDGQNRSLYRIPLQFVLELSKARTEQGAEFQFYTRIPLHILNPIREVDALAENY